MLSKGTVSKVSLQRLHEASLCLDGKIKDAEPYMKARGRSKPDMDNAFKKVVGLHIAISTLLEEAQECGVASKSALEKSGNWISSAHDIEDASYCARHARSY